MTLQDSVLILSTIVFMLITTIFAVRYCSLLKLAQEEYARAKNIVGEVVLSFKKRQDKQNENIEQLAFQVEAAHSSMERLQSHFYGIESQVKDLTSLVGSEPVKDKEVIAQVDSIKKEVDTLAENQQKLQHQLNEFEKNAQQVRGEEKNPPPPETPKPFANLTETEHDILQFLLNEGAKTAPEVEARVGKTREHTARLMKKLWQEGYIERDTHRIPYIYRVTESFKKMDLKELEKP